MFAKFLRLPFTDWFAPVGLLIGLACFAQLANFVGSDTARHFEDARAALAEPEAFHNPLAEPGMTRDKLENPEKFRDKFVYLESFVLIEPGILEKNGWRFQVEDLPPATVGDHVSVIGRFHREGYIRAVKAESTSNMRLKRGTMYAVSLALLAALLWLAGRRLRGSLREGLFEPRRKGASGV